MGTPDKLIADWLGVSLPTFYRWRDAGLLPIRPDSALAGLEIRARINKARDKAAFDRRPGQVGRTPLSAVAQVLEAAS